MTNDNAFTGAVEIGKKIARGAVTSVAATQVMLERIERLNGPLKCYETVLADQALSDARKADREIKAGRMIDTGGLMPVQTGAQVRITDGKLSVIDGPFVETKEVVGGYAIFELRNKEEAVAAAVEFMQLHREHMPGWDGTCEVRAFATPGVDGACQVEVGAQA